MRFGVRNHNIVIRTDKGGERDNGRPKRPKADTRRKRRREVRDPNRHGLALAYHLNPFALGTT